MTTDTKGRAALLIAVFALIVSVAGVGGSAVAVAIDALNAHRVDGFHAVGAGASASQRAGKLVATNGLGKLPAGAIPARTYAANYTVPAQALNVSGAAPTRSGDGVAWANDFHGSATLDIARPKDWAGGNLTYRILFEAPDASTGNVRFFIRPSGWNNGNLYFSVNQSSISTNTVALDGQRRMHEVVVTIPASRMTGRAYWYITLQRDSDVASSFSGSVTVHSVTLNYTGKR
jgi:hypothetical protein